MENPDVLNIVNKALHDNVTYKERADLTLKENVKCISAPLYSEKDARNMLNQVLNWAASEVNKMKRYRIQVASYDGERMQEDICFGQAEMEEFYQRRIKEVEKGKYPEAEFVCVNEWVLCFNGKYGNGEFIKQKTFRNPILVEYDN